MVSTPPSEAVKTDPSAPPSFSELHLNRLNSFLLHHSYILGYTLSRTDLNLHKALIRQFPQFCSPVEGQSKCQVTDASFHTTTLSPAPDTLPHVRRWAGHIASITEAEEASLPMSNHMLEDVLHSLVDEVKARIKIMADYFVLWICFFFFSVV